MFTEQQGTRGCFPKTQLSEIYSQKGISGWPGLEWGQAVAAERYKVLFGGGNYSKIGLR